MDCNWFSMSECIKQRSVYTQGWIIQLMISTTLVSIFSGYSGTEKKLEYLFGKETISKCLKMALIYLNKLG